MKLRKEDNILIIAGKNKGRKGKILRVFPKEEKILVEGINLVKHHMKPRKSGEKGQIVTKPAPLPAAKAKLICPKCNQATRVGYKTSSKSQKSKIRICKKCNQEF